MRAFNQLMMFKAVGSPTGIGVFTVNSSGKKVTFSPGNLQATYLGNNQYSWGFAENQYDYIGNAQGNTSIDSQVVGKKVDLFGWTKDGLYSDGIKQYGINTSQTNSDYGSSASDVCCNWGETIQDGNDWFVLTKQEWTYLIETRIVNGGTGKGKSYSLNITYGNIVGMVLYPDDYTGTVISGTVTNLPEGVVFFPASGRRRGSTVDRVGTYGQCWSSSLDSATSAYVFYFYYDSVSTSSYNNRWLGYSVRLVREI